MLILLYYRRLIKSLFLHFYGRIAVPGSQSGYDRAHLNPFTTVVPSITFLGAKLRGIRVGGTCCSSKNVWSPAHAVRSPFPLTSDHRRSACYSLTPSNFSRPPPFRQQFHRSWPSAWNNTEKSPSKPRLSEASLPRSRRRGRDVEIARRAFYRRRL